MQTLKNVLYTAEVTTHGGRDGTSKSSDGHLEVSLSTPKALGGDGGEGTNPEQLFAAGYSACFIGALKLVMEQEKQTYPEDGYVKAKVSIGPITTGFSITAELNIFLGDIETKTAQSLVEKAHFVCPYSNATRDNIKVTLNVL